MNSSEKLAKMLRLEPPKDRSEIPFYPMILTWCGTATGTAQAEMMRSNDKWVEAMDACHEMLGMPDATMTAALADTVFLMGLPSRVPGVELGDNDLYQFVETDAFKRDREDEYAYIKEVGYQQWHAEYLMGIQKPPFRSPEELGSRFQQAGMNIGRNIGHFLSRGIEPISHLAASPVFDSLSMIRSMQEFLVDLVEEPGPIADIVNKETPASIASDLQTLKASGGSRVSIYAMRSSASFMSPAMFEEFAWPALKQMMEAFWQAGITNVLHADSNWLPMLKYFLELPKGSVHFELDGSTDIFKAYDIIGGWHSLRGDVGATMLAFGTPDEVRGYCERLIEKIGMKGGFMLGSGCEVPLNAKFECVDGGLFFFQLFLFQNRSKPHNAEKGDISERQTIEIAF